jgi:hypothetical protein
MNLKDLYSQMNLVEMGIAEKEIINGGCPYCVQGVMTCADIDNLACINGSSLFDASTILFWAYMYACE